MSNLASFLQGASNSAAGTVSAPVDGIAWLLRKAGMSNFIGPAPIGGSDWMAQQGFTRAPQNPVAGLLGEAIGGVAPMAAAAKAPQIARGLLTMGENAAAPVSAANAQRGAIDVYHGSPHSFDSFDMSKIGTGEGAQAYGHGLYFAEHPEVAKNYATDRSYVGRTMADVPDNTVYDAPWIAKQAVDVHGDDAAAHLQMVLRANASKNPAQMAHNKEVEDALALVQSGKVKPSGNLYETRLAWPDAAREATDPLGPQHFLQWDKPLSEQPANVRQFFEPHVAPARASFAMPADPRWGDLAAPTGYNPTGQELMHLLRDRDAPLTAQSFLGNGLGPQVSNALHQSGIPGIRYLDQGSRAVGQGSANYVVFDDAIPKITGRK